MQQPEGPRHGGNPAATQASEEDDDVIPPGQVPSDLNENSKYPEMLSDEFMQEFDNLINNAESDHSEYEEMDLIVNSDRYTENDLNKSRYDTDRYYNNDNDTNNVDAHYTNENFDNFTGEKDRYYTDDNLNNINDDNDRLYTNENNFNLLNGKDRFNVYIDSNNNQNNHDNCWDDTDYNNALNDYSCSNRDNQFYENDLFHHSLSKNKNYYENHDSQYRLFKNENQFNHKFHIQHKPSQNKNQFQGNPNFQIRQSFNNNQRFYDQSYNNYEDKTHSQSFNQRQSFDYNRISNNPSSTQNTNHVQGHYNNFNETSNQPTMAELMTAINVRNKEIDNLSNRFNEFVKQPAAAPAAPQLVQTFSDKFKNRSRDPEPNLAKLEGVLPCVKNIVNLDPDADTKHCIYYDINEENSWLRLPKPSEYSPTLDNIPETIGSFASNMDFPGPSKGWWPTSETIVDNPREVKTPAQKFIRIPSKATEPQYEAFIQADPLIFVDKQDSQKKKIKLQPEFFGQEQSIYWQGNSTIVSNLETKARSTLKALNQNSQLLKESSARRVNILENLDSHKTLVDGVLTDNPEGPTLRDSLTKDQLLKELEYSVYSDSLLESNNSLAKDICKAQIVECRVDLRHYVLSRTNKDSRNPLFQALKFSCFRSPTLFGQPPRYLAKQAHVNPTCDDFRVKPKKRQSSNLAGLYNNSPKRGKGRHGQSFRGLMPRRAQSGKRTNTTRGSYTQYNDKVSQSTVSKNEGGSSSRGRAYRAKGKGRGKGKSGRK